MRFLTRLLAGGTILPLPYARPPAMPAAPAASLGTWSVTQSRNELRIHYCTGTDCPQYGALHLNDSFFRLNYGPTSGWGTSIILLPTFWSGERYYQDAPITATWRVEGSDLVLSIAGTIASLSVQSEVRLFPPTQSTITAQITTRVSGSVPLDSYPGEAFKPVTLSTMHISHTQWDARQVYANCETFSLPASGWIVRPPRNAHQFGVVGGTSSWKTSAPTIEVMLDRPLQVTGWVTQSTNPNDDNVGLWAASDQILPSWSFRVTVAPLPSTTLDLPAGSIGTSTASTPEAH